MGLKHVRLNIFKIFEFLKNRTVQFLKLSSTYLGINGDLKFSLAKDAEKNLNDFDSGNIDSKIKIRGIVNSVNNINYNINSVNSLNIVNNFRVNNFYDGFQIIAYKNNGINNNDLKEGELNCCKNSINGETLFLSLQ